MAGRILRWMVCFSLALICMLSAAGALMLTGCTNCGEDAYAQDALVILQYAAGWDVNLQ